MNHIILKCLYISSNSTLQIYRNCCYLETKYFRVCYKTGSNLREEGGEYLVVSAIMDTALPRGRNDSVELTGTSQDTADNNANITTTCSHAIVPHSSTANKQKGIYLELCNCKMSWLYYIILHEIINKI